MKRRSFLGFALLAPFVGGKVITETIAKAVPSPWSNTLGVAPPLSYDSILVVYKQGLIESFDRELFDGDWTRQVSVPMHPSSVQLIDDEEDIEMRVRQL